MEPIGFTVGIVGLAGLFSTCVECFNLLNTFRAYGLDYEILLTKFDIEKARFLEWGTGTTEEALIKTLEGIKLLLTDADELRLKYGFAESREGSTALASTTLISKSRLELFKEGYARFQARIAQRQKKQSIIAKSVWAIQDRGGFALLLQDLHDLVDGLYSLAPISPEFRRLMVKEDIESFTADLGTLKLVEEACSEQEGEWSDAASSRVEATELASEDRRHTLQWIQDTITESREAGTELGFQADDPEVSSENGDPFTRAPKRYFPEDENRLSSISRISTGKRRITPFIQAYESSLLLCGVILEEHKSAETVVAAKPYNIKELVHIMRQVQSSNSHLTPWEHDQFQKVLKQSRGGAIEHSIISLLTKDINAGCISDSTRLSSLDPITTDIVVPRPDIFLGAQPESLHPNILKALRSHIVPSNNAGCPIAPNILLEVKGNKTSARTLERSACYLGALGARGILSLQLHGKRFQCDGNAYTFTSTYNDGTLRIFASYPVDSRRTSNRVEYHMFLLGTWDFHASFKVFKDGVYSFYNIVKWAESKRTNFINEANARWESQNRPNG